MSLMILVTLFLGPAGGCWWGGGKGWQYISSAPLFCEFHIQVPDGSVLLSGQEVISGTHAGPYKMRHQGSQDTMQSHDSSPLLRVSSAHRRSKAMLWLCTAPCSGLERAAMSLAMTHVASSFFLSLTLAPHSLEAQRSPSSASLGNGSLYPFLVSLTICPSFPFPPPSSLPTPLEQQEK